MISSWFEMRRCVCALIALLAVGCAANRPQDTNRDRYTLAARGEDLSPGQVHRLPTIVRLPPVQTEAMPSAAVQVATQQQTVPDHFVHQETDGAHAIKLASAEEVLPEPAVSSRRDARLPSETGGSAESAEAVLPGSESSSEQEIVRDVTMANILASVAGRNPEVGFASQRYAEAYARLIAARVPMAAGNQRRCRLEQSRRPDSGHRRTCEQR